MLIGAVLLPATAGAQAPGETDPSESLVLFPLVSIGSPHQATVEAIDEAVSNATYGVASAVLADETLAEKLGANPVDAVDVCADDVSCLAALGQMLEVSEVVVGWAREGKKGKVVVLFLAVDAEKGTIRRKLGFVARNPEQGRKKVAANVIALFGRHLRDAGGVEAAAAGELPLLDLEEIRKPVRKPWVLTLPERPVSIGGLATGGFGLLLFTIGVGYVAHAGSLDGASTLGMSLTEVNARIRAVDSARNTGHGLLAAGVIFTVLGTVAVVLDTALDGMLSGYIMPVEDGEGMAFGLRWEI